MYLFLFFIIVFNSLLLAEEFMPLNKFNLFDLTQNSQLSIRVSVHVCVALCTNCNVLVLVMHNVCHDCTYTCIC